MEAAGYIDIISAIETLCSDPSVMLKELWNRMIFNICISNTDDHLRNHGFLLSDKGWRLSPCFDVNPDPEKDHMALLVGDTTEKSLDNALKMAEYFRISADDARKSIKHIQDIIKDEWESEADKLKISRVEKERMRKAF